MLKLLQNKFADFAANIYDRWAGAAGKLSAGCRWPQFSSWLEQQLGKRPGLFGVELFVALSLAVNFYFLVRPTCLPYRDGNAISKSVFCCLSEHVSPAARNQVQLNWKKRLAGPMLSGWLLDAKFRGQAEITMDGFQDVFGFYHAAWLFLFFLVLMVFRRDALWIMAAVFAGLMYNLTDPANPPFYYPWDMPTMLFFTLACLLYNGRRMGLLMAVVWIGGLFKETTLCCALLILLGEHWSWKKRVAGFVATVLATFTTNKLLMALYGMKAPIFAMNDARHLSDLVWHSVLPNNILTLFRPELRHVLFANAGSLFIILLLPWRNRQDVIFKLLIVTYIIGEFFYGIINEFRIWYEILPLGWMLIADNLMNERAKIPRDLMTDTRAGRALKGSYWLMMGALLAVAAGAFIVVKLSPPPPAASKPAQFNILDLISAAPKGDLEAQYNLGRAYQNGFGVKRDLAEAAVWYQRAAEKGHSDAQNSLAMLLAMGRDYAGAAPWFERAAAQGNADAQYNLGVLHRNGLGVRQNYELAGQWFQKAAELGHAQAQIDLAKMYELGRGVKPDYVEACKWLKLAELQGNEEAANELKTCSASMTADQIATAEKLVREFKAAGK
ncbi:MAG: tetratricopeptide repeat protein [Verrucomicrobiia bacterium]